MHATYRRIFGTTPAVWFRQPEIQKKSAELARTVRWRSRGKEAKRGGRGYTQKTVTGLGDRKNGDRTTVNTSRKATCGLPNHHAPFDAHICAVILQNLFVCPEVGLQDTESVAFPIAWIVGPGAPQHGFHSVPWRAGRRWSSADPLPQLSGV